MSAIGEAGAAQLAELAKNDPAVQNARADAAIAAARAARPGAGYLTRLKAVKADAEAQEKLAALAVTQASHLVGGLATAVVPPWPPVLPLTMPPTTVYAQAPAVVAPTETEIRHATILCDAAISACAKWVAAAVQYKDAAREYLRLAALVPELERSPAEVLEHNIIKVLHNNGNPSAEAPKMKADADAKLLSVNVQTASLTEKATLMMAAVQIARLAFNPPGSSYLAANVTPGGADAGLENAAGFATLIGTKAFKTVTMPDGSKSTTPPSTTDSLLASGTNAEKKALPVDIANPNPPPPRLPMGSAIPISLHADCVLDLDHMSSRHCRTHFTFDPSELMAEEDVMMSELVVARTGDLPKGQGTDARAKLLSTHENNARKLGAGKTTTLWPEGITPDQIAAAATLALVEIKKDNVNPIPFQQFVYPKLKHQHSRMILGIAVGPLTLEVSLGVSATGPLAGDTIKVVMFYPVGQESLTVSDCHTLKQACGI